LIAKGAEANLYLDGNRIIKERIEKKYRAKELDIKLRRGRTKREAKLLENAKRSGVDVPRVLRSDDERSIIEMEFIDGRILKDMIPEMGNSEIERIAFMIGKSIARLHNSNIIHNDLTTSNMILSDDRVFFIDFGLGLMSTRIEERGMDLVVLKKSLRATHPDKFNLIWKNLIEGYKSANRFDEIMNRVRVIERRVRYME